MKVNNKNFTSIWCEDNNRVFIIDQRWLPHEFKTVELTNLAKTVIAIKDMWVRGAPLIGVTAAFGFSLSMLTNTSNKNLLKTKQALLETRPTAINLHWAVETMYSFLINIPENMRLMKSFEKANELLNSDIQKNSKIGQFGFEIIKNISDRKKSKTVNILTHCNAGWLATVDWGTATSPIYFAKENGVDIHVYVDETRPRNQGAQLTTWEFHHNQINHHLIVDNAGGHLMQHNEIDMVLVGSDRTSSNGDVCNKIGTYLKALAAKAHKIPFYVAAPLSTVDLNYHGENNLFDIECRDEDEILKVKGMDASNNLTEVKIGYSSAYNPAFDITPSKYVSKIICEKGIFNPSDIGKALK